MGHCVKLVFLRDCDDGDCRGRLQLILQAGLTGRDNQRHPMLLKSSLAGGRAIELWAALKFGWGRSGLSPDLVERNLRLRPNVCFRSRGQDPASRVETDVHVVAQTRFCFPLEIGGDPPRK